MTGKPAVTAIIPVYNGERYLAEAIDSVFAQTTPPDDVIVVDDGSDDGSAAVAQQYSDRVRYIRQPHGGIGSARNHGVRLARGEFLSFLDADDLWTEGKQERQLSVLSARPVLDMVFGVAEQFHSPELPPPRPPAHLQRMPGYVAGSMLVRRVAFERVGPFETNWKVGEFISWYARAMEFGLRFLMLPDVFLRRRIHQSNTGIQQKAAETDYAKVLKAALDRRRAARAEGPGDHAS